MNAAVTTLHTQPALAPATAARWVLFAVMLGMYAPTLYGLLNNGLWSTSEHGHGPLVLAVSLWLMWSRWRAAEIAVAPRPAAAWAAMVFGVLLYIFDALGLARRTIADMNWKTSLIIGCAQALSLSPGTSRSGITMTAARGLGFVRPEAARFSFLLSIPANGAASILIIGDALKSGETITGAVILTGVLTFFVALGTITILMRMVRHMSFLPFAVYRVLLGAVLLGLIYSGMPLGAVN